MNQCGYPQVHKVDIKVICIFFSLKYFKCKKIYKRKIVVIKTKEVSDSGHSRVIVHNRITDVNIF